jgi:hypothetical protein
VAADRPNTGTTHGSINIVQGSGHQYEREVSVSVPANAAQDGSFKVALPEGERSIMICRISLPAGFSVNSFTYGSVDC